MLDNLPSAETVGKACQDPGPVAKSRHHARLCGMQVRKARRDIELAREGVEDDRKRLVQKEARLAEQEAEVQERQQRSSA